MMFEKKHDDTIDFIQQGMEQLKTSSPKSLSITSSICDDNYHMIYMKQDVYYDKYYGIMNIPQVLSQIIEHPLFQRLKHVAQLGPMKYKYTFAGYSRDEHSIGVAHLAKKVSDVLKEKYPEISYRELLCLQIAALAHDLGHGPFSHSFDHLLKKHGFKSRTKSHEVRSQKIIEYIIHDLQNKNTLPIELTDNDIHLIQYFIDPKEFKLGIGMSKRQSNDVKVYPDFLEELFTHGLEDIVNNISCRLDIDKMDYLIRDARVLETGRAINVDPINSIHEILVNSCIIEARWVFNIYTKANIEGLIMIRSLLHTTGYNSIGMNAIECMLTDALLSANDILNFTACCSLADEKDFDQFCQMTDDYIINAILRSDDSRLDKATDLICRIMKQKNLYQLKTSTVVKPNTTDQDVSVISVPLFTDKSSISKMIEIIPYCNNGEILGKRGSETLYRIYGKNN